MMLTRFKPWHCAHKHTNKHTIICGHTRTHSHSHPHTYTCMYTHNTVDGEKFAGLNVPVFNPIEVFVEILSCCLGQKCLLFSIIKERHLYSWENFRGILENREKRECLARQIFPRLWYIPACQDQRLLYHWWYIPSLLPLDHLAHYLWPSVITIEWNPTDSSTFACSRRTWYINLGQ